GRARISGNAAGRQRTQPTLRPSFPRCCRVYCEQMKSSHGTFAAIVWIIAGTLLYNTEPEAKLFSWQTPVVFILGTFARGQVLGRLSDAGVRRLTPAPVSAPVVSG